MFVITDFFDSLLFLLFFIWVAVDATMKGVCVLLQYLNVIAKGSETVVMVPLENTWQRSPIAALTWTVRAYSYFQG